MFSGRNAERQKCAVYPQPLSALLFSSWRNCWSEKYVILCFHILIPAGKGGEAVIFYLFIYFLLGLDMMLINGSVGRHEMRHHAGEQCKLSRRKGDFKGITEAQQLRVCYSPAGLQGRPTNPFLCSYLRQISNSLCV